MSQVRAGLTGLSERTNQAEAARARSLPLTGGASVWAGIGYPLKAEGPTKWPALRLCVGQLFKFRS